jgi:plastocyanin
MRIRSTAGTGALLVAAGLLWSGPAAAASVVVVKMSDFDTFQPETVRIHVGDTVEWRNTSRSDHDVTGDAKLASHPEDVQLPAGAAPFTSGYMPPGKVFQHVFDVPGTYRYVCRDHENFKMVGTVIVAP